MREAFGRREGAAAAGADGLPRAAPPHPRRADEPSRRRQPRGARPRADRIRRRRHPDQPRPPSRRGDGRPAVDRPRRDGQILRRRHGELPRGAPGRACAARAPREATRHGHAGPREPRRHAPCGGRAARRARAVEKGHAGGGEDRRASSPQRSPASTPRSRRPSFTPMRPRPSALRSSAVRWQSVSPTPRRPGSPQPPPTRTPSEKISKRHRSSSRASSCSATQKCVVAYSTRYARSSHDKLVIVKRAHGETITTKMWKADARRGVSETIDWELVSPISRGDRNGSRADPGRRASSRHFPLRTLCTQVLIIRSQKRATARPRGHCARSRSPQHHASGSPRLMNIIRPATDSRSPPRLGEQCAVLARETRHPGDVMRKRSASISRRLPLPAAGDMIAPTA